MSESKLAVKTLSLTPTYHPTLSTQTETESLSNRAVPFKRRNHLLFQSGTGGFYFDIIAPAGAIPTREAAINENEGLRRSGSKTAFQLLF